ncbi:hypothetical protein Leryth_003766 [Lithospermum erythrorhizon]|nr:hypothetical protein Leryth_003766 [Lithospermum erythrorhizon]
MVRLTCHVARAVDAASSTNGAPVGWQAKDALSADLDVWPHQKEFGSLSISLTDDQFKLIDKETTCAQFSANLPSTIIFSCINIFLPKRRGLFWHQSEHAIPAASKDFTLELTGVWGVLLTYLGLARPC